MIEVGTPDMAIDIVLSRAKHGIKVHVNVWPEIEQFFEQWSGGSVEAPTYGRQWLACPQTVGSGDGAIKLWALGLTNMQPGPMRPYSLYHTGHGFFTEHGYVNVSFLRLVGASAPGGRSIIVEAVMDKSEVAQAAQKISEAANLFYDAYLRPATFRSFVGVHRLPTSNIA